MSVALGILGAKAIGKEDFDSKLLGGEGRVGLKPSMKRSTKDYNRALMAQTKAMEGGKLGYDEATMDNMAQKGKRDISQEVATIQRQATGIEDDATRLKALSTLADSAAEATAQNRSQILALNAEKAEAQRQDTMDRLNEQRTEELARKLKIGDKAAQVAGPAAQAGIGALVGKGQGSEKKWLQTAATVAPIILQMMCWAAREVLPGQWRDCRTYILFGPHPIFRKLYAKHGEAFAAWIHPHPWAKAAIRPAFRYFAWQGRRLNRKYPQLEKIQAVLP